MPEEYSGLGKCVDRTVAQAMESFCKRYYPQENAVDAVALYVRKCVVWTTLLRGGRIEIQAHVEDLDGAKGTTIESAYIRKSKGKFRLKSENLIS